MNDEARKIKNISVVKNMFPANIDMSYTIYELSDNETFDEYLRRFLKDNQNEQAVQSECYPDWYPDNQNWNKSFLVEGGIGINVTLHVLDINPITDFLYFRGGNANTEDELGPTIVGTIKNPMKFIIVHTNEFYIQFKTGVNDEHRKGFFLTYSPFGELPTTTTESTETITVPAENLQSIELTLEINSNKQINETWDKMRVLLCESTNEFLNNNKHIRLEKCNPDNVTFISIIHCPRIWPNYANCVIIELSIPLWNLNEALKDKYDLRTAYLKDMWANYGQKLFKDNYFNEYMLPDNNNIILMWIGISIGIILIFLVILYSIWKLDFFQDYNRMTPNADDQNRIISNSSEIDISMFPSPHQIVPSLFPNNETGLPYDYEKQPISFSQSDFQHRIHEDLSPKSVESTLRSKRSINAFSPIDFNNTKSFFPEDEEIIQFKGPLTTSPRTKAKLILAGIRNHEESKT